MNRRLAILLLLVSVFAGACSSISNDANEVSLRYGNGWTEDKTFKGIVASGTNNSWQFGTGAGDDVYSYRTDQRTFVFEGNQDNYNAERTRDCDQREVDSPAVSFATKDGLTMSIEGLVTFTLNTQGINEEDAGVLHEFHKRIGVKTKAWKCDGWTSVLNTYFGDPLEKALDTAAKDYNARDLYFSKESQNEFAGKAVKAFETLLTDLVGGNYFCGPKHRLGGECDDVALAVGRPVPPPGLADAFAQVQIETELNTAAATRNQRIATEGIGDKTLIDLYGQEMAAWIRVMEGLSEEDRIQWGVVPGNGDVSVARPPAG